MDLISVKNKNALIENLPNKNMFKEILKDEYHIMNPLVWIRGIIGFAIGWLIAIHFFKEMAFVELQKTNIKLDQCQKIIEKITE